ncbi:MAG: FkbM family methyltransferase [Verrucomicrobiota bacterium]|jgi:FkbM family methyltransferase
MNFITKIVGALHAVANHPLNRQRKLKAILEYGFIQSAARLVPGDICVGFPNNTRLLVPPRMKGAAHYITPRLCEFEEMAFVMHFLRPSEVFADVGANIGAFTIIAAGVAGAQVTAFEPGPEAFHQLELNIRLNGLVERVKAFNAAVGQKEGTIQFTAGLGTENCVITGSSAADAVTVRVMTLDQVLTEKTPALLKVDVEGFETEVFAGAGQTLKQPQLRAMIVERSDNGSRYGFDEATLHQNIRKQGFIPCNYHPFERRVSPVAEATQGNIIYVRDISECNAILHDAPPFKFEQLSV